MQDLHSWGTNPETYKNIGEFYPTIKQGPKPLLKKPNEASKPGPWAKSLSKIPLDPWGEGLR